MKKTILAILIGIMVISVGGCGSKYSVSAELDGAPKWVMTPDVLQASASAKIKNGNINFAKTSATARARANLAKQFKAKIKALYKDFNQQTGSTDDKFVEDAVSSSTIQELSSQTLEGSRVKDIWISKTDKLWALVEISETTRDKLSKMLKNAITSSYKNDEARYQQFLSRNAHNELDKAIDKEFGK